MRRRLLLLAIFALAAAAASSANAAKSSGGHAGALYRFGLGTRTLGFAGAVVSLAHDPTTVLVNPAGAAFGGRGALIGSHTSMALDRSINVLGFGRQLDPRAGFSIAWVNAGVDGLVGYDGNGNVTGTLDDSENTIAMSFGSRFGRVAAGVTAKWYRYHLSTRSSSGWAFDAGFMAEPFSGFRVGAAIRDLVGKLVWTTNREEGQIPIEDAFPTTLAAGVSYQILPLRTSVAADYERVQEEGEYLHFGVSWQVVRQLRLRAGYRWLGVRASAHKATPTAGATLTTNLMAIGFGDSQVSFDYAVLNEPLGLVHSLGVKFDF